MQRSLSLNQALPLRRPLLRLMKLGLPGRKQPGPRQPCPEQSIAKMYGVRHVQILLT